MFVYSHVAGGHLLGVLEARDLEYEEALRATGHKFRVTEVAADAVPKNGDAHLLDAVKLHPTSGELYAASAGATAAATDPAFEAAVAKAVEKALAKLRGGR